jgi:hypothetical protein
MRRHRAASYPSLRLRAFDGV